MKTPAIGLAVKQGKAQVQRITYNAKGTSTIEPLSAWVTLAEAQTLREKILRESE